MRAKPSLGKLPWVSWQHAELFQDCAASANIGSQAMITTECSQVSALLHDKDVTCNIRLAVMYSLYPYWEHTVSAKVAVAGENNQKALTQIAFDMFHIWLEDMTAKYRIGNSVHISSGSSTISSALEIGETGPFPVDGAQPPLDLSSKKYVDRKTKCSSVTETSYRMDVRPKDSAFTSLSEVTVQQ